MQYRNLIRVTLLLPLIVLSHLFAEAQSADAPLVARIDTGSINGARYQILIPPEGTKKLVLYAHGYISPWDPPLVWGRPSMTVQPYLLRGFAVAQSEYRRQGWAIQEGIEDTEALRKYFVAKYGTPDTTFISGGSMGGLITIATIEKYPQHYNGALPLCGILDGSLSFGSRAFDLLIAFDYFFPDVVGVPLDKLGTQTAPDTIPVASLRAAQARDTLAARMISSRFGIEESDFVEVVAFYYQFLRTLMIRAGGQPFDTQNTVYFGFGDDNTFNRRVRRYAADSAALAYIREWYTPTGKLWRPTLALHTIYDKIVSPASPNSYSLLARSQGTESLFAHFFFAAPGHCAFGVKERALAFDLLRLWAASDERPQPGEIRIAE